MSSTPIGLDYFSNETQECAPEVVTGLTDRHNLQFARKMAWDEALEWMEKNVGSTKGDGATPD